MNILLLFSKYYNNCNYELYFIFWIKIESINYICKKFNFFSKYNFDFQFFSKTEI